jgi:hypothetical protein
MDDMGLWKWLVRMGKVSMLLSRVQLMVLGWQNPSHIIIITNASEEASSSQPQGVQNKDQPSSSNEPDMVGVSTSQQTGNKVISSTYE